MRQDQDSGGRAYLEFLTGEATLDEDGRKRFPACPVCKSTSWHAAGCDVAVRFGAEARALYYQSE